MPKRKDGSGYVEHVDNLLRKAAKQTDTVAKLKKKADIVFSRYIRHRDGRWTHERGWETVCITCGRWNPLKSMQNGHFVSRAVNVLRYDEQNCNGQCYGCNVMKGGDLYEYALQLDKKYGEGTAEKLHSQRHKTHKLTVTELQEIIDTAKAKTIEIRHNKPDVLLATSANDTLTDDDIIDGIIAAKQS